MNVEKDFYLVCLIGNNNFTKGEEYQVLKSDDKSYFAYMVEDNFGSNVWLWDYNKTISSSGALFEIKKKRAKEDNCKLTWTHEGDSLVSLMLLEGLKYIMCEIGEEDKQYLYDNEQPPRFIVEKDEQGCFVDVNGNMWQHSQAINNDGTVMTYDDYLMLKQLKEVKCEQRY